MSEKIHRLEIGYTPSDTSRKRVANLTDALRGIREDAMVAERELHRALKYLRRVTNTALPEEIEAALGIQWPEGLAWPPAAAGNEKPSR